MKRVVLAAVAAAAFTGGASLASADVARTSDDCTEYCAKKAVENGGKIGVEPFDIDPGRIAVIADPQGGHFYIIKLNQPAD